MLVGMIGIVAVAAVVGCATVFWRLSPRQRLAKLDRGLHPQRTPRPPGA